MEAKKITASTIREEIAEKQKKIILEMCDKIVEESFNVRISKDTWDKFFESRNIKLLPEVFEYVYKHKGLYVIQAKDGDVNIKLNPEEDILKKYPAEDVRAVRKDNVLKFYEVVMKNEIILGKIFDTSEIISVIGKEKIIEQQKKLIDDEIKLMLEMKRSRSYDIIYPACNFFEEVIDYVKQLGFEVVHLGHENNGFTIFIVIPDAYKE